MSCTKAVIAALVLGGLFAGCEGESERSGPSGDTGVEGLEIDMDDAGREFVELVLAMGELDSGYVDAYYGPEELARNVSGRDWDASEIRERAVALIGTLERERDAGDRGARASFLVAQLHALVARIDLLAGESMPFDAESLALYGARAPRNDETHFAGLVSELDALLPGRGPIQPRYESWREAFAIPQDRLDAVFRRAIEGCRERTTRWIELPETEEFVLEYVGDKPWSGYNWYQGDYRSLIQINTDFPIHIDRAIDLACHEGYPGHHVYNVLREKELAEERGWVEHTIYPLYSPLSLIAEGSANYGIEMAFPGEDKTEFERSELYPLAGIDPSRADEYAQIMELVERLDYAENEAARRYLDGELSKEEAAKWLQEYALSSPDRALQRLSFYDTYRAYVINYNLGKDIVRRWVELRAGEDESARWEAFEKLLSSPLLPHDLLADLE